MVKLIHPSCVVTHKHFVLLTDSADIWEQFVRGCVYLQSVKNGFWSLILRHSVLISNEHTH